jgi:glycosyltransferase involved in cell wall biosynthesis
LRLALDASYSLDEEPSGVAVYSREILEGLAVAHPDCEWLWCYRPHRFLKSLRRRLPRNARRRLLGRHAPPARLFHGLNQRLPQGKLPSSVCTFHDLFVLTGEYSSPEFRRRFTGQARDAARRADLVICVSAFTASQAEALLGVEKSRLRVVHHGVRFRTLPEAAAREPVVLSVGAIQRRKNTLRLVEAFEATPPGWRLVLAGSSGYGAAEAHRRVEQSPRRADIEITGYLPDRELRSLYARASIFAFPSLDEGFGMPAIEAMACGIPVLTSNCSALPEVCGEAALLVDPHDTEAIARGLTRLMESESLRDELRRKGLERAARFTWERSVQQTWEIYRELLDP